MNRIAVVGAGAIGSIIAARLALAGSAPLLLGRGAHLHAIREHGLALEDGPGTQRVTLDVLEQVPADAPRCDLVILCTKAQDLRAAVTSAGALIGPQTTVMAAVNGLPWWLFHGQSQAQSGPIEAVDPGGWLWRRWPAQRLLGCVVHLGASLPAAGHVRQAGDNRLSIGELDGSIGERVQSLADTLTRGGLPTAVSGAIRNEVWSKLVGNASSNPLSVVTGATLDHLLGDASLMPLVRTQMLEVMAIGAACGADFALTPEQRIDVGRRLGAFRTSMLQDFDRGRPLELAAISDALLELADRLGVAVPTLRAVRNLVDFAQRRQAAARGNTP